MGKAKAFPICKSEVSGMKRAVLLMLVLLLLTACGVPAAEPTPDVTADAASPVAAAPEPSAGPVETISPEEASRRAVPETMTLPDTPFEPESYWLAEPFGDGSQALLLMSAAGRFKCWYNYWFEHPDTLWRDIVGNSFTEAEAAANVDGGTLTLKYAESADTPRPERFTAITRDDALRAHRDMPYNDELCLPLPTRVERAEWEATPGVTPVSYSELGADGAVYEYMGARVTFDAMSGAPLYLSGFNTESADFPFKLRGVGIGSSGEDVLASFPSNVRSLTAAGEHHTFYGSDFGYMGTWDTDDDWRGGDVIMVSDGWTITRFILDENGTVYKIEFWNSVD